jgi:hypothetical protein
MKSSIKKTPSRTAGLSSLKRKVDSRQSSKKKAKMAEQPTQEELHALSEEISLILNPLKTQLDSVINAFPHYQQEAWYKDLRTRQQLIPTLVIRSRDDLSDRAELEPFLREGAPFTQAVENSDYKLVKGKLDDLDACVKKAISQFQAAPPPSTYCLGAPYRRSQSNFRTVVRDGRAGTVPVALELLHISFRTFTYWSFLKPYPLPGSPTLSEDHRSIDEDAFIKVYQAANQLLFSMPQFYTSHDDRLDDFKKALLLIFPENDLYEWCHSVAADQGLSDGDPSKYKVDITYRYKSSHVPIIFVEVKLELGEGGNPFWQNHRLYQSYIQSNLKARNNGAPVFFVQLCGMTSLHKDFHISYFFSPSGTHLGVGGGFCDAQDNDQPPIVLQLGGYVNLQFDFVGRNLRETVNTLWALSEAVKQIPKYVFFMQLKSCP